MKVCVQGLWHLGSVTAACLASVGHTVVGFDDNGTTIAGLKAGKAPLLEPGLNELLAAGLAQGRLSFTGDRAAALAGADLLWVAYDTPVDEDDRADVEFVVAQIKESLAHAPQGIGVLVSSQLPVGSIRQLESYAATQFPEKQIWFACSPENLRLGKALEVFLRPDRIIVGVRPGPGKAILEALLQPLQAPVVWMGVEAAEMTKHAINAFLALSVTFANEIASLCEFVGADAKEVERGLKSEQRIGPKAYLSPGGAFAGGTLARDIEFLGAVSRTHQHGIPVLSAVKVSNDAHKGWVRRKLTERFSSLAGKTIAVWGLTYKVGTDTLRRSLAVELCDWLLAQGARVQVHDPVVQTLPDHWSGIVGRSLTPLAALDGADALVVGTEWPEFREIAGELLPRTQAGLLVLDANRHLASALAQADNYLAVGTPAVKG